MNGALVFLAVLGVPALVLLASLWRGYVLAILWGWFIVPLFGAPALSIPFAVGLALTVSFLTNHRTGNEATEAKSDGSKFATVLIFSVIAPLMALAIGWVVHQFV